MIALTWKTKISATKLAEEIARIPEDHYFLESKKFNDGTYATYFSNAKPYSMTIDELLDQPIICFKEAVEIRKIDEV